MATKREGRPWGRKPKAKKEESPSHFDRARGKAKEDAEEPKVEPVEVVPAPEAAPAKEAVKAAADPSRPEGAPPAEDVVAEYETATHYIYKLKKDHTKIQIPK